MVEIRPVFASPKTLLVIEPTIRRDIEIKPEHKRHIGGAVLFIFVFMFATLIYTLIAVYFGVLEKVQIAFSLGFVVLLILVYVVWQMVSKRIGL